MFVSTFHATRLVISNWKMHSLSTFFDSLTKEKDKLIHMSSLRIYKGKDHALIFQGTKNVKSKEKQIVKYKKPKSGTEDESLEPIDEVSMKKFKKKWSTSKYSYCKKGFRSENKCFNKKLYIISHLLEKHNIEVPDELEKPVEYS